MNEKIKRYIEAFVPIDACTLRCPYCYITQHKLFDNNDVPLSYTPEQVGIAFSKKRLGGTCMINICGNGETLIPAIIIEYIRVFLEQGHYVSVVTNGTLTPRFKTLASFPPELLSRLFFKFSYHFLEFKKNRLTSKVFDNIKLMRDAGASFALELTPSDEMIPYIDEIKETAISNLGAPCHVTIARDERDPNRLPILTDLTDDEFYNTWGVFDSAQFNYKKTIFGEKRKEFCYAGNWSFWVNLGTGEMKQCYKSIYNQQIIKHPKRPIRFLPIGHHCEELHCYNGHSFLCWGDIPELEAPTYAEERNRICEDGSEWLKSSMKEFMSSKLYESNSTYSPVKRYFADKTMDFLQFARKTKRMLKK